MDDGPSAVVTSGSVGGRAEDKCSELVSMRLDLPPRIAEP